ncbi:NblA/ycf18 family protein [Brunnivagina elsteri]|uniref:Phycobilisome degradation family protein n=1 Tax=Brunnivagina elsteri CCALA 953 TaxID=987040 RepID=A0A2A2TP57_9CYAN|nr:NblA/ycf18 family protein [Calothrix elsteri]PAX59918.1 phycobilisome degradation family protein [Calothrix elsteri CCALA 953]
MDQPIEITLEQEFSLIKFIDQVQQMSREQAQEFLILQHKQMMIRERMYQEILKQQWKLDMDFASL